MYKSKPPIRHTAIRSSFINESQRDTLLRAMKALANSEVAVQRFDSVGPSIGEQVASRAALAVGVAALAVVIYIMIAFQKVKMPSAMGSAR